MDERERARSDVRNKPLTEQLDEPVIELARDGLNPGLEWLGVFFNIADMRTVHSRDAYTSLKEHVGDKLFETTIRQSIAYANSAESAVSIVDQRPDRLEHGGDQPRGEADVS